VEGSSYFSTEEYQNLPPLLLENDGRDIFIHKACQIEVRKPSVFSSSSQRRSKHGWHIGLPR